MITATDLDNAPEITKAELYADGAKLAAFEIPTPIDPRRLRAARQEVAQAINDSTDTVRVAGVYHEARTSTPQESPHQPSTTSHTSTGNRSSRDRRACVVDGVHLNPA